MLRELLVLVIAGSISFRPAATHAFDCVETKCPAITTCAEADYKLKVCGHSKRDADDDGIPCEDLCGKDMATYQARVKAQSPSGVEVAKPSEAQERPASALGFVGQGDAVSDDTNADANDSPIPFTCSGKRTCGQMLSCAEAKFYLASCRVTSLDRDGDGVPCNSLCRE